MSSRLFWKLYAPFAVTHVIGVLLTVYLLGRGANASVFSWTTGTILILSLVVVARVVAWTSKPTGALFDSIQQLASGALSDPIYVGRKDEFGHVAAALNYLRGEMIAKSSEVIRLAKVLSAMTDGVIAIDSSLSVQFANNAAGKLLDFDPEMAAGRPLLESVRSHKMHELVLRVFASKTQDELEIEWGNTNPKSLFLNATYVSGDPTGGIIMMINNLSEIRHLQTMRRDFVANVSHELKTPLSSIKAYAETLRNGALDDTKNRGRFLRIIEEQADRLSQLISDLLSLARIEQGKTLMEIQQVSVHRVVDACLRDQQHAADEKSISLHAVSDDSEIAVNADEEGMRQILVNLINNAIKYTPEQGEVVVGWQGDHEQVQVYVQDTGVGIPEAMQDRVFERFFRVDKARSRELGGTGLGLAIVKHLAQSLGGNVEVESTLGKGSRFTVTLPRSG